MTTRNQQLKSSVNHLFNGFKRTWKDYFIEELSDSYFDDYLRNEIAHGRTEREVLSEYMAAWIEWQDCADRLRERIRHLSENET